MLPTFGGTERGATSLWWADMLGRKTGEAVWIGELVGDRVRIVHQAVRVDGVIPWYACALGQAIVARLDDAACEALLAVPASRLTGMTITDPAELRLMLAVTRQRGYAVEAHAATLGDAGIAAAVYDSGRVVGAVGIVGPAERLLSPERQQDFAHAVCVTAQALSEEASSDRPKSG